MAYCFCFQNSVRDLPASCMITMLINVREKCHPLKLTMDLHQVAEELEVISHRGV